MASFLDDIGSAVGSAFDWMTSSDFGKVATNLGVTALAAYALNQTTKSTTIKPKSTTSVDYTAMHISPSTENRIPIVYGNATVTGIITDARIASDNMTMTFVIALSEATGKLDLGSGDWAQFTCDKVYWEDQLVQFKADGTTVDSFIDATGKTVTDPSGLIQIYIYNGNSTIGLNTTIPAFNIVPGWDSTYMMSNLIFAVVVVKYSKAKNITKLGKVSFNLTNSMTQPGDVLFDFMTNPIYGCGIPEAEIYSR